MNAATMTFAEAPAAEPIPPKRVGRLRPTWLDAVVIAVILGAGLGHLNAPFGGDQFLFLIGAQKIVHHGVMYRDFWDLKQPLIYYLYALAGLLFGFTPTGVHLFEVIYQTLFAVVLIAACAMRFTQRWSASVVPLLSIGAYYAFASNYALTSVEAFAGFPLFVCAVLTADALSAARNVRRRAIIAGAAGAVAVALKLIFLPIVAALWLTLLGLTWRRGERGRALLVARLLGLGWAVPIALLAGYFARAGVLDVALRTAFIDPPAILRNLTPGDRSPFWPLARAFGRTMWPLLVLAVFAARTVRRTPDRLSLALIAWALVGGVLSVVEVWSYEYRFYIVIVPLGVLGARGLAATWSFARERGTRMTVAYAGLVGIMLVASAVNVERAADRWRGWAADNARAVAPGVAFLGRRAARSGAIYVFGDPRLYYFTRRDQAVPINGWSPQLLLPAQWHDLRTELAAASPPYIFVESDDVQRVARSPEMLAFIAHSYAPQQRTAHGTWYARR